MAQYNTQPEMTIDLAKTYSATLHTNHGDIGIIKKWMKQTYRI